MSRTEYARSTNHTAGVPFSMVFDGAPDTVGSTVRERRTDAIDDAGLDEVRHLLCEPRGHAMYGCFLTPPDDAGAHFGVFFWHQDGYSTACGHGTIALGVWAVESGWALVANDGVTDVVIGVPSGRVTARVHRDAGRSESVTFRNLPAYVLARGGPLRLEDRNVEVDASYGGATYASVPAGAFDLTVSPEHHRELIAAGRAVKAVLAGTTAAAHPRDPWLCGIYGTILYEELGDTANGPHQRNVTVFADGQVDRFPCGSGTSARVALLGRRRPNGVENLADARLDRRHEIYSASCWEIQGEGRPAGVTQIRGTAYQTGDHLFVRNPGRRAQPRVRAAVSGGASSWSA